MLSEIIRNIINDILLEYKTNFSLKKNGGKKDFKKIAQAGMVANPMDDPFNEDNVFNIGSLLRNVPGSRYPRNNRATGGDVQETPNDPSDEMERELRYSLGLGNKDYKDMFLFAYGVHRMLYDREVETQKDKKDLSNICIYLSENPWELNSELTNDNVFNDRDWSNGIANFYGMSFKELKSMFAKKAKEYVSSKEKKKIIKSKIVTSNGYYVYPCYTFGTANYVGSSFTQGMCFFNSPTFWQQHTGDSGALFMFKRIENFNGGDYLENGLFNDNKAYNEIVISTHLDENGGVYIDGITNGNNVTYYNQEHHPANKLVNSATDFSEKDIQITSQILGTINGEEVFKYCIERTKNRQNTKYDEMFKNSNYKLYVNMSNKYPEQKIEDRELNITLFPSDGKVYCINHNTQKVFLIEPKGFITCNGREVQNTETPFYQKINSYMPRFFKDWGGFRHNKRNKYFYTEQRIRRIRITESKLNTILKLIK